jgi:undecaprenyl phosphate N,N'-diacetylbacillosamine 1-phosphate transferase
MDWIFAALLLFISIPLLFALLLINAFYWRKNPLYTQVRPGMEEKSFVIFKLRTLRDAPKGTPDIQRITKWGLFLRSTSMDELPQLFNILKLEMSFVGPRPLLVEYLPLYTTEQKRRHSVKPGITGLAQINGGNALSWEDKLAFDIFYANNISFLLDLKILYLTIRRVVFKRRKDGFFQFNKTQQKSQNP